MAKKVRKDNKGRVLKKGESQRKDLTYMYRWTDKRGERQYVYDRALEGLREQEEQIAIEISKGIIRNNATLNELIERYLNIKAGLATSTYENYLYYYQHSIRNDEIGLARAREIKKSDILAFYARKSQKDNFSNGTIHILHKIIHSALQLAVEDDMIARKIHRVDV